MAISEYFNSARRLVRVREPMMKPVGKPDAGDRHVRFDERGRETGRALPSTATASSSTLLISLFGRATIAGVFRIAVLTYEVWVRRQRVCLQP